MSDLPFTGASRHFASGSPSGEPGGTFGKRTSTQPGSFSSTGTPCHWLTGTGAKHGFSGNDTGSGNRATGNAGAGMVLTASDMVNKGSRDCSSRVLADSGHRVHAAQSLVGIDALFSVGCASLVSRGGISIVAADIPDVRPGYTHFTGQMAGRPYEII